MNDGRQGGTFASTGRLQEFYESEIDEHLRAISAVRDETRNGFLTMAQVCVQAVAAGKKIVLFGNGGSAADAQHIATELVVRFGGNRRALPAIALTTDTSALTAIGNDFGFEEIFSRQVDALCSAGDVAIGISTSGNSENVIRGIQAAKRIGAITVGLLGGDGGRMKACVDYAIVVPSTNTARIQEMHILIGHMLCGAIERELGLV